MIPVSLHERLERDIYANLVPYLLLEAVRFNNNQSYGYEMKRFVENFIDKSIPEGTLYPLLSKMSGSGYLESWIDKKSARKKRFYTLTPEGENELIRWMNKWQELESQINQILRHTKKGNGI